jgi:hypothetical protein
MGPAEHEGPTAVNSGDRSACPSPPWLQLPFVEPGMCHVVTTEEPSQQREKINMSQSTTNSNKFKHIIPSNRL